MSALDRTQLLGWIQRQRWYAGRSSTPTHLEVIANTPLGTTSGGEKLAAVIAKIAYAAGDPHTYSIPVLWCPSSGDRSAPESVISEGDGVVAVDALRRESGVRLLVQAFDTAAAGTGAQWFEREAPNALRVRQLAAEQSHTSVIVDETYVLKAFRRVLPGENPEVEVGRALHGARGARVARLAGALALTAGEATYDVLVANRLVEGANGFDLAVDDANADLVGTPGAHFPGAAYELGIALGALHDALTDAFGCADEQHLHSTVADRLRRRLDSLADVRALDPYREAARLVYADLGREQRPAQAHRIHGDLHLGQTLFGERGWTFLDFEGEPRRPLAERRTPDSPMRDVAGILRSFGYAAAWGREHNDAWQEKNADLFLEGYRLQRPDAEDAALLHAFVLDKALYEVGYEAAYRPERLAIPLRAVDRLTGG